MSVQPEILRLAETVAGIAHAESIDVVVIGAAAAAAHGYIRATTDLDFASAVDPYRDLPRLQQALRATGLHTELSQPEPDDPIGGMLRVWELEDEDGDPIRPVEIVNLINPHHIVKLPRADILRDAVSIPGSALRYISLPHLVLLKLYAGSRKDLADVVELLVANPEVDASALSALCKHWGLDSIDELVAEANDERQRR
ncbi:MAG TPA: hypothetical protein VGM88_35425 [Kofleriaceae bacterium]